MGDHFDISGVFETTEFEIAKSACKMNHNDFVLFSYIYFLVILSVIL